MATITEIAEKMDRDIPKDILDRLKSIEQPAPEIVEYRKTSREKSPVYKAKGRMWRLVHDGKQVIAIIEGTARDETTCKWTVEHFGTKEKAIIRAKELKLN